ncbi:MAG TPA: hypothetical protein VJZ71_18325 [Phycisphaerae bacterium]|nr:hypothetical protein [Phycisphaerae bacterium]
MDASAVPAPEDRKLDAFVHQIVDNGHAAALSAAVVQLLRFAQQVTESPASCTADNIAGLRAAGWSDAAIHDAVQIASYFNYINRVADALGVEPEPGIPQWGRS